MIKSQNRPKITWAITAVIVFAIWFSDKYSSKTT